MATLDIAELGLQVVHQNFKLIGGEVSYGQGLNGREQIVGTENRTWVGEISYASTDFATHRKVRAFGDQIRGRVGKIRIPVCNKGTPRPSYPHTVYEARGFSREEIAKGYEFFSDGTEFTDGKGFAFAPLPGPPTASLSAKSGEQSLHLGGEMVGFLSAGSYFSIGGFLYRICAVRDAVVTFNPPLREAVNIGAEVQTDIPEIIVRLQKADGWEAACDHINRGRPMQIDVVEAFDR